MERRKLTPREIAIIKRRRFMMMIADNGGERPEPEPSWNMRVVAHPDDGYEMPQTTGNFTLVKQDGDTYYYQHDGSGSTGNEVLGVYNVSQHLGVSDATFKDCEHITRVGNRFLMYCSGLTSIDLSPLSNITSVGNRFLMYCSGLTSIDLSPLSNITSVDTYFLYQCSGLTSIDLSPLSNVISIGSSFLYDCRGLTSLDLSPLSNVISIGSFFLFYCTKLTSIDLSPLSNVTSVGEHFLTGCMGLKSIDLSPLSNVTSICRSFLSDCNIKTLDLSPLSNVTSVGDSFLFRCGGLTSLKLPWTAIPTTATDGFMSGVKSTCSIEVPCESVDVYKSTSPWSSRADYINGGEGCEEPEPSWNMKVVAHPDEGYTMPTTTGNFTLAEQRGDTYYYQHNGSSSTTGANVLYDADNGTHWGVESVAFKNCEHITSIDNRFFNECSTLVSIDLSALSNVTTIDGNFLRKCSSLPSVDLSALSNVTTIQQSFLNGCSTMTTIDLSPLINCTYFNSYFLYNCTNLATLILPWVTDIPYVSVTGFMTGIPSTYSIIVPCESVDTYKATSPWKLKASHIVGDC